ncbi:MAG: nitroreductase family protein [Verrucomicrobia bacterium]|nr:nitroreductase family protein [Verrucomicrobiota bacterium]
MSATAAEHLNFLLGRRSIRAYKPGPIGEETVRSLLEAAMSAPSAAAKDPWRFVLIREREGLVRMANALPNGQMIAEAGIGIVVCGDLEAAHDRQLSYLLQDCSAAIENLLLAAHAVGLGACWLGIHPREQRLRTIRALLSLPPQVIPVGGIALGWPDEEKPARSRFNSDFVHHEKW